jgi:hypothetical protein
MVFRLEKVVTVIKKSVSPIRILFTDFKLPAIVLLRSNAQKESFSEFTPFPAVLI